MTVWMVRTGKEGEQEQAALRGNFVTIHWLELPDLSPCQDKDALAAIYRKECHHETAKQIASGVGQVWAFCKKIELGDLVVLPLHERPKDPPKAFAIGKVTGPYCYRDDMGKDIRHTRGVRWLCKDISLARFPQDIQKSLGCPPTVYQISRNNAEARILAVLSGQPPSGSESVGPDEVNGPLAKVLEAVRKKIAKFRGTHLQEAATRMSLINPVLGTLGWDVEDPDQVNPEFRPGGADPVDYALFIEGRTNPILLVEAKALDQRLDGWANKIMGHAGTSGATWVVLTNGDEYRIYYTGDTIGIMEMGIEGKLFRTVRLTDPDSSAERTLALLSRQKIGDLQGIWKDDLADRWVRAAIDNLFSPPHSRLVSFVRKHVGDLHLDSKEIRASLSRVWAQLGRP